MKLKCVALFLLASNAAFAENRDWLNQYLRSKSVKCVLTQEQLKAQVQAHIDNNLRHISEALKARGSDFQSIEQQRDQVEVGTFPKLPVFDFYVLEKVAVVIQAFSFPVQTTVYNGDGSTQSVEKGLWFPLTIQDPGSEKPCRLARISLPEEQKEYLPAVDLVIGEPPRVIAARLAEVIDISKKPPPAEEQKPKIEAERSPKRDVEKRHRPSQSRRRRSPQVEEPAEKTSAPALQDECAGDISLWKRATCAAQGR